MIHYQWIQGAIFVLPLISTVSMKNTIYTIFAAKKIRKHIRDQEKAVVFAEQVRLTQPSRSCLQPTPSLTQQGLCPTLAFCPMHTSLQPQYTATPVGIIHTAILYTRCFNTEGNGKHYTAFQIPAMYVQSSRARVYPCKVDNICLLVTLHCMLPCIIATAVWYVHNR